MSLVGCVRMWRAGTRSRRTAQGACLGACEPDDQHRKEDDQCDSGQRADHQRVSPIVPAKIAPSRSLRDGWETAKKYSYE